MKLGDKLYKNQGMGRIAEYICVKIEVVPNLVLFGMECQSCTHGDKCVVYVRKGSTHYEFVSMADNTEDQTYWHTSHSFEELYFKKKKDSIKYAYQKMIEEQKKLIEETEKNLKERKQELEKINTHYEHVLTMEEK